MVEFPKLNACGVAANSQDTPQKLVEVFIPSTVVPAVEALSWFLLPV